MLKIEKIKKYHEIELNIYKNNKFIACESIPLNQTNYTYLKNAKSIAKQYNLNELDVYNELIKNN